MTLFWKPRRREVREGRPARPACPVPRGGCDLSGTRGRSLSALPLRTVARHKHRSRVRALPVALLTFTRYFF